MSRLGIIAVIIGALALVSGIAGSRAQERMQLAQNLEAGKTPAQLFASDCAICHKSPQGLAKSAGSFGLSSFLREHYTASKESAAALSNYLSSVGGVRPTPQVRTGKPRPPKGEERAKASEGKPADAKPAAAKSGDDKKSGSKTIGQPAKPATKPAETAPAEAKPAEAKPTESKPAEVKPAEAKQGDAGKPEKTE